MAMADCNELGCELAVDEYLAGHGEIYFSCMAECIVCMSEEELMTLMVPQDIVCVSKMMNGDSIKITADSLLKYCKIFQRNMTGEWHL